MYVILEFKKSYKCIFYYFVKLFLEWIWLMSMHCDFYK